MSRRMSNRDRIARAAAEADATAREREEKRKKGSPSAPRAPRGPRARNEPPPPAHTGRMKVVWAVHAPNGTTVATYPYPHRDAAQAEAERLSLEKEQKHYVQQAKVPLDE